MNNVVCDIITDMLIKSEIYLVMMTCPEQETSGTLARLALEKNLVACVNLMPEISSMYFWKDKLINEQEFLLFAKTNERNLKKLESLWSSNHPYDVPEILAVELNLATKGYALWIEKCLSD